MSLTITANLVDLTNTADVGSAVFTLVGYGSQPPRVSGSVIANLSVKATANGSGAISQVILGNDVITPGTTTYVVTVFDASGAQVWSNRYKFTGSGSVDLSTQTPL